MFFVAMTLLFGVNIVLSIIAVVSAVAGSPQVAILCVVIVALNHYLFCEMARRAEDEL